jgi:hypothetical protein
MWEIRGEPICGRSSWRSRRSICGTRMSGSHSRRVPGAGRHGFAAGCRTRTPGRVRGSGRTRAGIGSRSIRSVTGSGLTQGATGRARTAWATLIDAEAGRENGGSFATSEALAETVSRGPGSAGGRLLPRGRHASRGHRPDGSGSAHGPRGCVAGVEDPSRRRRLVAAFATLVVPMSTAEAFGDRPMDARFYCALFTIACIPLLAATLLWLSAVKSRPRLVRRAQEPLETTPRGLTSGHFPATSRPPH